MKQEHKKVAQELLSYVRDNDRSVRTTPITDLFLAIYEASFVMGVREISRWLSEKKGVSISPSTISRALRFPAPHWDGYSSIIETNVRCIEDFTQFDREMLFGEDSERNFHFWVLDHKDEWEQPFDVSLLPRASACKDAIEFLEEAWFIYASDTRDNCREYLIDDEEEESNE